MLFEYSVQISLMLLIAILLFADQQNVRQPPGNGEARGRALRHDTRMFIVSMSFTLDTRVHIFLDTHDCTLCAGLSALRGNLVS